MIVLIDVRTLGKQPSGVGVYIYQFAKGFSKQKDIEVVLATDVAESAEIRELINDYGINAHIYGKSVGKGLSVWQYVSFLKKLIYTIRPDIFWEPNNLLPAGVDNPYGKFVVTIHDIFPVTMPECYGWVYSNYFRFGIRKMLKHCDAVLFISNTMQCEIERHFPMIKNKKRMVASIIVPPVIQRAEKKDYFFYIGNLEKRKGTDILLAAYDSYLNEGGSRDLYLAGKVREDSIQAQLSALMNTTARVHYLGYIDNAERDRRYAECGVFIFPSRAEGFGIPIIEALSCGTEVLASNLPVFREIADQALSYFDLQPNDADSVKQLTKALLAVEGGTKNCEIRKRTAMYFTETQVLPPVIDFFKE